MTRHRSSCRTLLCMIAIQCSVSMANATADLQVATSVYQCVINGQRIFSDQPCAKDAERHEIAESNRMNAQDTHIMDKHEAVPKHRNDSGDDIASKKVSCNKLREQQTDIQAQMRAGYTAKQGIRLRERLDKLNEKYRTQKCEWYR